MAHKIFCDECAREIPLDDSMFTVAMNDDGCGGSDISFDFCSLTCVSAWAAGVDGMLACMTVADETRKN